MSATRALRIEGRPYTTIETSLVKRLVEVVLSDAEHAFRPLSPVKFSIDRLETNPRFAAISRPANAAILTGNRFFPELISAPFHHGLAIVFGTAAAMALVAAAASALRGARYFHSEQETVLNKTRENA